MIEIERGADVLIANKDIRYIANSVMVFSREYKYICVYILCSVCVYIYTYVCI